MLNGPLFASFVVFLSEIVGRCCCFRDYPYLMDHFRDSHFLCEEDACAHAQFTNAFRTDIDLKVGCVRQLIVQVASGPLDTVLHLNSVRQV